MVVSNILFNEEQESVSNSLPHRDNEYYMRQMGIVSHQTGRGPSPSGKKSTYRSRTAMPSFDQENYDMAVSLPNLPRARSVVNSAPSYAQQLRATPRYGEQGGEALEPDWTAGRPSELYYRRSYTTPLSRSGRLGGSWRHITQVTGQTGNNLLFIEGTVKDNDVRQFPPYGIVEPKVFLNRYGQKMLPRRTSTDTQFNARAKKGFQYWYNEPKSNISQPPPQPYRTISGHQLRTRGVGYNC